MEGVIMLINADDFSPKVCVPSKTKGVNIKVFNEITKVNEAKTLVKHLSCDFKCNFGSTASNLNQKWNNETCQCEFKESCWNTSTCSCKNSRYLKSVADDSVMRSDEFLNVTDSV